MSKRDFYVKEEELDDCQVIVINKRTDSSFIVKGCAGSGKSILALWKAKQIQENGKSFLFIVYTKALVQYMKDGIAQIGLSAQKVESKNKCFQWNNIDGRLQRGDWRKGNYDYIIIDEAQDFSEEEILIIKSKANTLLLYGDSAQQLYKFDKERQPISMEKMAVVTGFLTEQLVFNHRLPKKIARLAEKINIESDILEERCRKEGTELPKILKYPSLNAQLDAIVEIIKNRNFEDVGILCRNFADVQNIADYLTRKGLNVERQTRDNEVQLNFNSSNPKIMTYHSSKGLQFEAVFLPECAVSDNDSRNALYVALTRTYQSLYIMHSGNLSSFFDAVPTNLYETSLIAKIEDL